MKRWMLPLVAGLALPAVAQAEEYRKFTLSDGREFDAIVIATEATGMRVRVPQGEMVVGFDNLADMTPIAAADYQAQPDWTVLVAGPKEQHDAMVAAFARIPHVQVVGQAGAKTALTDKQQKDAALCGPALTCITAATKGAPWMWIVTAKIDNGELAMQADVGETENRIRIVQIDAAHLDPAVFDLLEVTPSTEPLPVATNPTKPPPTVLPPKNPPTSTSSFTEGKVVGLSFVPLPGLPSLAQHDYGSFALGLAVAVPVTALWVNVAGHDAQGVGQHALLGVAGFYATTVAINQALGMHSLHKNAVSLGVAPTANGGATAMIGGTLK